MNVILRNSTRRMIDQSRASVEAEGFIAWLRTDGYTDYVIDCHIRRLLFVLPKLSSCTAPPTLREADLVAVFGRERRPPTRFTNFASTRRVYTRYLRSQGRLITEPQTPTEDLLRRYDQYLIDVRGLSASARVHHKLTLRALLTGFPCSRSLKKLSRDDVEQFILERSRRISRHSLQHEVGQLRAFLRYAHDAGLVRERLDSLDTPRTYRDELPPRALPWPSVLKLLRSIDRTSRNGWRDLTILHLIAYYGLRPSEVVTLRLESIDWEQGLLQVYQCKTRSPLTLPLDPRTLRVLRDYLQHGRIASADDSPMLFLRARCPFIPLERTCVGDIFRKRMREAGLPDCRKHVYRLRHTFAMRLLGRGVGMKAIGDVLGSSQLLRHQCLPAPRCRHAAGCRLPVPSRVGGRHV
jgi:integrase/recombinase XerD